MTLTVGEKYSRRKISKALGGSIRAYLPTSKRGEVVCGCFKPIRKKNPDAPEKVTIGKVGTIEPQLAEDHDKDPAKTIPIFLYRSFGAWEYKGHYRCTKFTADPAVLDQEMQANPTRGVIAGVLYFERVRD